MRGKIRSDVVINGKVVKTGDVVDIDQGDFNLLKSQNQIEAVPAAAEGSEEKEEKKGKK